VISIIPGSAPI